MSLDTLSVTETVKRNDFTIQKTHAHTRTERECVNAGTDNKENMSGMKNKQRKAKKKKLDLAVWRSALVISGDL